MALTDYLDSEGRPLEQREQHFLDALPALRYKDTGEPFRGTPKTIVYTDPIQYYDEAGRELEAVAIQPAPKTGFLIEPKRD